MKDKEMTINQEQEIIKFTRRIETQFLNGITLDEFIEILKEKKITHVIDVRNNTYYKPEFAPKNIREELTKRKIYYYYIKTLGNPFHKEFLDRMKSIDKTNIEKILRLDFLAKSRYLSYLEKSMYKKGGNISNPKKTFLELYYLIERKTPEGIFCLICYCNTLQHGIYQYNKCHRFWILEKLIKMKRASLGLSHEDYSLGYYSPINVNNS